MKKYPTHKSSDQAQVYHPDRYHEKVHHPDWYHEKIEKFRSSSHPDQQHYPRVVYPSYVATLAWKGF